MRDPELQSRPARVVSVGRNAAWIAFEGDAELQLAAIPKSRERLSLAPGDLVLARPLDSQRVVVERRERRSATLDRRTAGGRRKTMAANLDAIAVVSAFADPPLRLAMVDEIVAFAELHDLAARIVLTKPDLAGEAEVTQTVTLYRRLGYATHAINPKRGVGIEPLAAELASHRTLLIGQSGVGKSSLFRALGGEARIAEVSRFGRGRQTTSVGRLHRFPNGWLIDSPGVGEFALDDTSASEVAFGFIEFRAYAGRCRFTDCTHRGEPDCAVREASANGAIAASRYASYLAILTRDGVSGSLPAR